MVLNHKKSCAKHIFECSVNSQHYSIYQLFGGNIAYFTVVLRFTAEHSVEILPFRYGTPDYIQLHELIPYSRKISRGLMFAI